MKLVLVLLSALLSVATYAQTLSVEMSPPKTELSK